MDTLAIPGPPPTLARMNASNAPEKFYDQNKVDDMVLALLYLTLHDCNHAWKGHDFAAMDRLHEKNLIANPVGKTKSVILTVDGLERCEELFLQNFCSPETREEIRIGNLRNADKAWQKLSLERQQRILAHAWCPKCESDQPIANPVRKYAAGHLIIEAKCATCGGPVKFLASFPY